MVKAEQVSAISTDFFATSVPACWRKIKRQMLYIRDLTCYRLHSGCSCAGVFQDDGGAHAGPPAAGSAAPRSGPDRRRPGAEGLEDPALERRIQVQQTALDNGLLQKMRGQVRVKATKARQQSPASLHWVCCDALLSPAPAAPRRHLAAAPSGRRPLFTGEPRNDVHFTAGSASRLQPVSVSTGRAPRTKNCISADPYAHLTLGRNP